MNAIEKLIKRMGVDKKLSDSGFIHPDGTYSECLPGADHARTCRCSETTLDKYLKAGGARVFNHASEIAVEHWKPMTLEQLQAIINLARWNVIGTITINCKTAQCDGGYYGTRKLGNTVKGLLNRK